MYISGGEKEVEDGITRQACRGASVFRLARPEGKYMKQMGSDSHVHVRYFFFRCLPGVTKFSVGVLSPFLEACAFFSWVAALVHVFARWFSPGVALFLVSLVSLATLSEAQMEP